MRRWPMPFRHHAGEGRAVEQEGPLYSGFGAPAHVLPRPCRKDKSRGYFGAPLTDKLAPISKRFALSPWEQS